VDEDVRIRGGLCMYLAIPVFADVVEYEFEVFDFFIEVFVHVGFEHVVAV
jgi:hypothetical protein